MQLNGLQILGDQAEDKYFRFFYMLRLSIMACNTQCTDARTRWSPLPLAHDQKMPRESTGSAMGLHFSHLHDSMVFFHSLYPAYSYTCVSPRMQNPLTILSCTITFGWRCQSDGTKFTSCHIHIHANSVSSTGINVNRVINCYCACLWTCDNLVYTLWSSFIASAPFACSHTMDVRLSSCMLLHCSTCRALWAPSRHQSA